MKKAICIISNVILSYFYLSTSWMVSAAALFYLVAIGRNWSSPMQLLWVIATTVIVFTPIYCILGIVLSVIQQKKGHFLSAFLAQFLPFGTIGVSVILFLVPVWLEALRF